MSSAAAAKKDLKRAQKLDPTLTREALCGGCKRQSTVVGKLLKCGKCKMPYCSKECQVRDWKQGPHKEVCKRRVLEAAGRTGEHDAATASKIEKFAQAKSQEATALLYARLPDAALIAKLRGLDLCACVVLVDTTRMVVRPMVLEDLVREFDLADPTAEQQATIDIMRRNLQPGSTLLSAFCFVDSHPAVAHGMPNTTIIKSLPKQVARDAGAAAPPGMVEAFRDMAREMRLSDAELCEQLGDLGMQSFRGNG